MFRLLHFKIHNSISVIHISKLVKLYLLKNYIYLFIISLIRIYYYFRSIIFSCYNRRFYLKNQCLQFLVVYIVISFLYLIIDLFIVEPSLRLLMASIINNYYEIILNIIFKYIRSYLKNYFYVYTRVHNIRIKHINRF